MIHSSDKEEVAVDTWSECRVPPPWGSDPSCDAGTGNEVTQYPGEGQQLTPLLMEHLHHWTDAAQKYQPRANSCRDPGSPMRGTSGADTLLRRFFGWRNPTLFGEQHSAPLPLLVSLFGLRGRAVLAAWEVFLLSSQEKYRTEMREWGGKMSSCTVLSNIFGIHLINITWPKPKNEMLGCKETVTTFTYFSLGRQPGIAAENFPKPKETRQYICLFRGFLVAFMAIITWSLYLDQRVIQHKIFSIDKLPFC